MKNYVNGLDEEEFNFTIFKQSQVIKQNAQVVLQQMREL